MKSDDITLINPAKTGYTFTGWTGTGLTGLSTDVTIPGGSSGDRSYTANWTPIIYTITYTLNNGSVSGNPTSYDLTTNTFTLNNPTREGYDFTGWLLSGDESETLSIDLSIPTGSTGNREYLARWALHVYTLSYDLDGGTVSPDNPVSYTIESEDFTLTNPIKDGYDFAGWSFDNEISLDVTIPKGTTGNREYTANWTAIVYTISYDLQGGSETTANPTS